MTRFYKNDWSGFKKYIDTDDGDLADHLFQCCVKPLRKLLIKENPNIIDEGGQALLDAMKRMAVLHATTYCHAGSSR